MAMGNNLWRSFAYNSHLQIKEITDLKNNDLGQVLLDQNFDWGVNNNNGTLKAATTNHLNSGYPPVTFQDHYWHL